jgi:hypothetical protein
MLTYRRQKRLTSVHSECNQNVIAIYIYSNAYFKVFFFKRRGRKDMMSKKEEIKNR